MKFTSARKHEQRGSALVVGLILLLALTILGVAGMTMSRTELQMTGNSQFYSAAKAAALGELDFAMDQSNMALDMNSTSGTLAVGANAAQGTLSSTWRGQSPVPGGGFSAGKFAAYHFEFGTQITQTGRPVNVSVLQGAYLIGPAN